MLCSLVISSYDIRGVVRPGPVLRIVPDAFISHSDHALKPAKIY